MYVSRHTKQCKFQIKSRFTFVRIHEKYLISKLFRRIYQIKNVKIYIHVLENYKK